MSFLKTDDGAGLVAGTSTVTLTGSIDASQVVPGTAVFINGSIFEGISGTAADGGGNSTITLRNTSNLSTIVGGQLVAFNTFEGMREALANAQVITSVASSLRSSFGLLLTSTNATESINIDGVMTNFTPYQYLIDQLAGASGGGLLTAKGQLIGFTTDAGTLAVGTDDFVLTADAAAPFGFSWKAAAGGGGSTPTTTEGDIIIRGSTVDERLPIGTATQVLAVNAGGTRPEYVTLAAPGETNTASNVGVGGISVFKQKAALDLEFNSVRGSEGIKTALDATNNEIDITPDVNSLVEDTSPDIAADFAMVFDASTGLHKKVLLNNWPNTGGSSVISETILGAASQTISASLANITEFDFEIHLGPTASNAYCGLYINSDKTVANYHRQYMLEFNGLSTAGNDSTTALASRRCVNESVIHGKVRLVNSTYYVWVETQNKDATGNTVMMTAISTNNQAITDFTNFEIDSESGTQLFPTGSKLVIRDPNAVGATGPAGPSISSSAPATATSTGVTGTMAWDANFIYMCIATDTWKRTAISTW